MTDDTDDHENGGSDVPVAPDTRRDVPEDTPWELSVQLPFDEDEKHDLTATVVDAVARTEGVSPMEVDEPPLYEVLDVAALEGAFFGSDTVGTASDGLHSVEFMYRDHRIVVRSDAWVQVYDPRE